MHRRFIAFIIATAVIITGLSAAPARAGDDAAKIFAGLAALAIIGAAIENSRDDDDAIVSRRPAPHSRTPYGYAPRPLPRRVTRYDLPLRCLNRPVVLRGGKRLIGDRCLQGSYGYTGALPRACRIEFWNGRARRAGYEPGCLRDRGYRFARR